MEVGLGFSVSRCFGTFWGCLGERVGLSVVTFSFFCVIWSFWLIYSSLYLK